MRPFLTILFCVAVTMAGIAQEVLTNLSVVQMVQLGLDEDVIMSKINASTNDFDISTPALMALKQDGVPSNVVAAMLTAANDPAKKVVDMNDYRTPHPPGIYYYNDQGQLTELLSTVTNGTKTRNVLGASMTYGLSSAKVVSQVSGTEARLMLKTAPKFYFYFNQQTSSFNQQGLFYGFINASSPNEFVLARMNVKKGTRELVVFSSGAYSQEYGVDERQAVHFNIEQVGQGIFEVNVGDLAPGQYCFLFSGVSPSSQSRVYDFGIQ